MTSAVPATVFHAILSPRKRLPQEMPNGGIRKVTVSAPAAPASRTRRKYIRKAKPVHTTPSATTAATMPGGGSRDGIDSALAGSTSRLAAHMLPRAVETESTGAALRA